MSYAHRARLRKLAILNQWLRRTTTAIRASPEYRARYNAALSHHLGVVINIEPPRFTLSVRREIVEAVWRSVR